MTLICKITVFVLFIHVQPTTTSMRIAESVCEMCQSWIFIIMQIHYFYLFGNVLFLMSLINIRSTKEVVFSLSSVGLLFGLLAGLLKMLETNFNKTWRWVWPREGPLNFCARSKGRSRTFFLWFLNFYVFVNFFKRIPDCIYLKSFVAHMIQSNTNSFDSYVDMSRKIL